MRRYSAFCLCVSVSMSVSVGVCMVELHRVSEMGRPSFNGWT